VIKSLIQNNLALPMPLKMGNVLGINNAKHVRDLFGIGSIFCLETS
jgi:hypothetical protein